MWPDNETARDFLNFSGVADTVAEIIVQARGRPISIGVSGAWGIGKSSLPVNLVSGGILRSQTTIPAFGRRSFLRRVHSSHRHPHGSSVFYGDRQPLTGIEAKLKLVCLMPSSSSPPPE